MRSGIARPVAPDGDHATEALQPGILCRDAVRALHTEMRRHAVVDQPLIGDRQIGGAGRMEALDLVDERDDVRIGDGARHTRPFRPTLGK